MRKTPRYVDGKTRDPRNPSNPPTEEDVKRPEMKAPPPGGDPEHKRKGTDETNDLTT